MCCGLHAKSGELSLVCCHTHLKEAEESSFGSSAHYITAMSNINNSTLPPNLHIMCEIVMNQNRKYS